MEMPSPPSVPGAVTCAPPHALSTSPGRVSLRARCVEVLYSPSQAGTSSAFAPGPGSAAPSPAGGPRPIRRSSTSISAEGAGAPLRAAGPPTPKPAYSDDSPFDRAAIAVFRRALARELGGDTSARRDYEGVMDLALALNRRYPAPEARSRTRAVLRGLFPNFIIKLFPLMFARPFPAFSAKLNAWITSLTCVWLMVSCETAHDTLMMYRSSPPSAHT